MTRLTRTSTSTALALCLATSPAYADLTAEQVWTGMENLMEGFGYTVSATEATASDGLTVSDISMSLDLPEENTSVSIRVPELSFVENADGSVQVAFPPSIPIAISAAPDGEDDVSMVLDYANTDLELVVSGEGDSRLYTYTADRLSVSMSELIVNGTPVNRDEARVDVAMTDVSGTTSTEGASGTDVTQDMQAGGVSYDMAFNDPESDDAAVFAGSMENLTLTSVSVLPDGFDPANTQTLPEGFRAEGTLRYENGQLEFAATESAGTSSGTTQSGSVELTVAMDDAGLRYDVAATDQAFALTGAEIPVPVNVSLAESAFNVTMPLAPSDTPSDIAFGLTLGGFEMSDLLWNMVDPGAVLPRDPATIALNLTGQATPFVNFFDPAAVAQLEATGGVPGELNALTLDNLTIEAAGAKLGGEGAFTFDNTDLQTFGGVPRPTGEVTLSLEGANGLIDKLIGMGLLTTEDAMGARMMMSMFAVPDDGPDSLTSTITINEQGHVLANGMRIQ